MDKRMTPTQMAERRRFVKRAAYTAPAIVTLAVAPSFAKAGSVKRGRGHEDDGPGNSPGNGNGNGRP